MRKRRTTGRPEDNIQLGEARMAQAMRDMTAFALQ